MIFQINGFQIHLIKVIEWLLAWAHCHWICSNKRHKPNPARFVRRGRAAKADDPDFDLASDVDDSELASWLEKPGRSMAWQVLQSTNHKKLTKYLPPGNLMELYQHYAATRQLLAAKVLSSTPKLFLKQKHSFIDTIWWFPGSNTDPICPQSLSAWPAFRYSTFARVCNQRWSDVLKFREKNLLLWPLFCGRKFLTWYWFEYFP